MTPVPALPGFHPDPSIVAADGAYYLVTSSFSYLPGLPVYRSDDLETWTPIVHVADRPGQLRVEETPGFGGAWAPTIRYHDGRLHVIVTDMAGRMTVVFHADDPAGPWSDGTPIEILGIDPDLAWDDDGTCLVTYGSFDRTGTHHGIEQVGVDLATGRVLDGPRSLWPGTGLAFPEAPHLYRIGDWWYLVVAEGGTERGHAVSVARSTSPSGPFEGCPANPVLTASGTVHPTQCTGHADLVQAPDGRWAAYLLGVWVQGSNRSFGPLGRETYRTDVTWEDGWPTFAPVAERERTPLPPFVDDFVGDELRTDWIAVRAFPTDIAKLEDGRLVLDGSGATMDEPRPSFVGRRQTRLHARIAASVTRATADTVGGLSLRYDERHHLDLELQPDRVVARLVLPTIRQEQVLPVTDESCELAFEMRVPTEWGELGTSDLIDAVVTTGEGRRVVATFDGRYLSAEVAVSFVGRVAGVYCEQGRLTVDHFEEAPHDG